MKKLVILDYTTSTLHFHDVPQNVPQNEEFVASLGYKPSQVAYMFTDNLKLNFE